METTLQRRTDVSQCVRPHGFADSRQLTEIHIQLRKSLPDKGVRHGGRLANGSVGTHPLERHVLATNKTVSRSAQPHPLVGSLSRLSSLSDDLLGVQVLCLPGVF